MQVCRLFFCKNLGNTSGILVADFTKGFIDQFRVYIRLAVDLCAEGALGGIYLPGGHGSVFLCQKAHIAQHGI